MGYPPAEGVPVPFSDDGNGQPVPFKNNMLEHCEINGDWGQPEGLVNNFKIVEEAVECAFEQKAKFFVHDEQDFSDDGDASDGTYYYCPSIFNQRDLFDQLGGDLRYDRDKLVVMPGKAFNANSEKSKGMSKFRASGYEDGTEEILMSPADPFNCSLADGSGWWGEGPASYNGPYPPFEFGERLETLFPTMFGMNRPTDIDTMIRSSCPRHWPGGPLAPTVVSPFLSFLFASYYDISSFHLCSLSSCDTERNGQTPWHLTPYPGQVYTQILQGGRKECATSVSHPITFFDFLVFLIVLLMHACYQLTTIIVSRSVLHRQLFWIWG